MSDPIRVVIADDSVLLREGLVRLLEDSGFEVVGQAGDAEDLLRKVGAHKPDVAVVDVRMPPTHTDEGLRAAHTRRREDPLQSITPREREVLGLMAEGRSNAAIAEALVVTERAVEKHVTSIFSKLDLTPTVEDHRRVLAVLAYLRAA
jgi:DNA-binding NarL/FixJ family response regulator